MCPRMRPSEDTWAPRLEVTSWPFDQQARQRLIQFRHERMRNLDVVFCGDDTDLRGAHLCGFDFRESWFTGCVLDKVRMLGANLTAAGLAGASLEGADLTACVLVAADLSNSRARRCVLAWARLARAEIYEADLREADLIGADLDGALLGGSDFRGARLENVQFGRTAIKGARMADCLLEGARGTVSGPVDISKSEEPELLDGADMEAWFRERRARVSAAPPREGAAPPREAPRREGAASPSA